MSDNGDHAQARFALAGAATVVVTVAGGVSSAAVHPADAATAPALAESTVTFTVPGPVDLSLEINGVRDSLFLFADPLESGPPQLGDPNVKNVMDFAGVHNDGTLSTAAIQSAINWVSANHASQNVLYFPNGVYRTATLQLQNYAQLYFASGAVLLADGNPGDYSYIVPNYIDQVDVTALLLIRNVHDIKIFGRGEINANGYNMYNSNSWNLQLETIFADQGSYNLDIDDVMFTNPVKYQSHFGGTHDVTLNNVKFFDAEDIAGKDIWDDGFKVNGSYNVTYTGGWISTHDDAITIAADGPTATQPTQDVNISGVTIDTRGNSGNSSLRFAFSDYPWSNVTVTNIHDITWDARPVFRLAAEEGYQFVNNVSNVRMNNWTIENGRQLLDFDLTQQASTMSVSDVVFENVTMPLGGPASIIYGSAQGTFNGIYFINLTEGGKLATDLASAHISTNQYASEVTVQAGDRGNLAPAATATSTSIAAGQSASAAVDGDWETFFKSGLNPAGTQYLTLTWPTGQDFSDGTLICDHCQGQAPTNWDVQVSPDGSTGWTTVASSGTVSWACGDNTWETHTVSFNGVHNQQGVRLQLNSENLAYGQYQIDEVEVDNSPGDLALSSTASTTSLRAGDSASAAADGNWDTFFKSTMSPSFPQYLTMTWPTGQNVSAVTLVCDYCQGQAPTSWDVQVSADGSTGWTTVASSGSVGWAYIDSRRESHTVAFPTVYGQKGVRLQIDGANLAYGQYQIDEVEVTP